ncbi:EamA family transporter [Ruminiclostridium josui]|uniref:EamA family transporter n=1 Tax=Ruminiclostridium josui TaxID=1499 RepID=UPI0004636D00|nr:EamA family transporter [Ruminiclostridium josui]
MQGKYILLTILNSVLIVFGQTLWKLGLIKSQEYSLKLLLSPLIIAGVLTYGISTILWLYILSKLPFSTAYPLNSIAYALSLFVGFFIFKEYIDMQKIFGTILILAGVFYIARG